MLTPKEDRQEAPVNPILSVRLSSGELARMDWLTDHLRMTRTELVKALVNQEYMAQWEAASAEAREAAPAP